MATRGCCVSSLLYLMREESCRTHRLGVGIKLHQPWKLESYCRRQEPSHVVWGFTYGSGTLRRTHRVLLALSLGSLLIEDTDLKTVAGEDHLNRL